MWFKKMKDARAYTLRLKQGNVHLSFNQSLLKLHGEKQTLISYLQFMTQI
jgi:hypothetical protein